ncbi:MAG TPA: sigma-70 family RNA polymerase sigma factor, partial [Acidimicrobiales bacterium]|nr:sigma-70 family RNA polymerase sigma factor [Acidimicrobiales bacterium]
MATDVHAARSASAATEQGSGELVSVVRAAARGESPAWEHLTRRFGGSIMAVARSCRLCEADAWEVQQTTWLRLIENIDRIEQPERIGSWLTTTAYRECLRLIRMRSRIVHDEDAISQWEDKTIDPADLGLITEEQAILVRKAFERLPPRCQRLLSFLSANDALSYKDISDTLS